MQYLVRFLIGGCVVCAFALLGDVIRTKSFAGIFGAAPSVAIATLALTIHTQGAQYAAVEARTMMVGALALACYAAVSKRIMWSGVASVPVMAIAGLAVWAVVALLGWTVIPGR